MPQSLSHTADLVILRAEARNAIAPFIQQATIELRKRHAIDAANGVERRHVTALPELQHLLMDSVDDLRERIASGS